MYPLRWNQDSAPRLHCDFLATLPLCLHPFLSWISKCSNLPFGTQGKSWRLGWRKGRTENFCAQGPSCSVSQLNHIRRCTHMRRPHELPACKLMSLHTSKCLLCYILRNMTIISSPVKGYATTPKVNNNFEVGRPCKVILFKTSFCKTDEVEGQVCQIHLKKEVYFLRILPRDYSFSISDHAQWKDQSSEVTETWVQIPVPPFMALVVVQTLSCVQLFVTPGTTALQASLSFIISQSLLKVMSVELVMTFNHLILCLPLLLFLQSFPGSFPMSQLFTSSGQSIGTSTSASVFSMNIQCWFPLWLTGLISLQISSSQNIHCPL